LDEVVGSQYDQDVDALYNSISKWSEFQVDVSSVNDTPAN
jgi:hypothetical protein